MKKNVIALTITLFLLIGAIFYFLTGLLVKNKTSELESAISSKTKAIIQSNTSAINKSIENSDDIGLLINIEALVKFENISSVFILDSNNAVLIHNNTEEWNKQKKESIYDNAIATKKELLQKYDDKYLLYSIPLKNENTLFCLISLQDTHEMAKYWKIKYFTIAAAALIIIILLIYIMAKVFIVAPFNRTKKALENSTESLKNGKYNEITDIFASENEKFNTKIESLKDDNASLSEIVKHLSSSSGENYLTFIILNSQNNIVYAIDNTDKFLKPDFSEGSHILEALKNPQIIEAVNKSLENPGYEIIETIDNYKVSTLTIGNKESFVGTIVKVS